MPFEHYNEVTDQRAVDVRQFVFMPPTLEKLKGHISLGLSVCPAVRPCVRSTLIKIQYMDSSSKNN